MCNPSLLGNKAQGKCQEENHPRERLHTPGRGPPNVGKVMTVGTEVNLFPSYPATSNVRQNGTEKHHDVMEEIQ